MAYANELYLAARLLLCGGKWMGQDFDMLLRQNDEPHAFEFPSNFDYERLNHDVLAVYSELKRTLNQNLEIEDGTQIQDASFHAAIIIKSAPMGANTTWQCELRFSNFGRLAAFTEEESISDEDKKLISTTLAVHRFVLIPTSILERVYDGVIPEKVAIRTWWIRFFDYG